MCVHVCVCVCIGGRVFFCVCANVSQFFTYKQQAKFISMCACDGSDFESTLALCTSPTETARASEQEKNQKKRSDRKRARELEKAVQSASGLLQECKKVCTHFKTKRSKLGSEYAVQGGGLISRGDKKQKKDASRKRATDEVFFVAFFLLFGEVFFPSCDKSVTLCVSRFLFLWLSAPPHTSSLSLSFAAGLFAFCVLTNTRVVGYDLLISIR